MQIRRLNKSKQPFHPGKANNTGSFPHLNYSLLQLKSTILWPITNYNIYSLAKLLFESHKTHKKKLFINLIITHFISKSMIHPNLFITQKFSQNYNKNRTNNKTLPPWHGHSPMPLFINPIKLHNVPLYMHQ